MVVILGPFAITGILTTAYRKLLMLFPAYFKAFLAPESVNPFEVYKPSLLSKLYSYPAIAIPWMLYM